MSRNFELLTHAGKIQEILGASEEPEIPFPAETDASTPSLAVDGAVRDEITKLVHNLFLLPGAKGPRQIVFAGTESRTGCSWVCAHAAEILASKVRASVCVVDCNLRSPGLHKQFGIQNHHGVSDALIQANPIREYVSPLARKNLWLLSCGASGEHWKELVSSERMRLLLTDLRAEFDYVLIDAGALNTSDDAIVLGSLSDGVVLVLKANISRRETARKALQELLAANVPTLGAVLNQRTYPIPEAIYNLL